MSITLASRGTYAGTGAEIGVFDELTQRSYVIAGTSAVEVLDASNLSAPTLLTKSAASPRLQTWGRIARL